MLHVAHPEITHVKHWLEALSYTRPDFETGKNCERVLHSPDHVA